MIRSSTIAVRLLISLVVFTLCAELAAIAAYYVETGAFFYTHEKTYPDLLPTPEDRLVIGEAIHPYFGVTHRPGTPFDIPASLQADPAAPARQRTNNFGFVSPYDYPFSRARDDQFLVGLFGGSVGLWFCQVGAPRLVDRLKQHPFFHTREIVPLCFSHEGYKQPQQALVLAYFLSRGQGLDLVVNLDGFNEVALGALNHERGFDASMPSVQHLDPLINLVNQSALTPQKLESLAAIFRTRQRLVALSETLERTRVASVHVALDWYYRRVLDRYTRELGRFAALPSNPPANALIQATPPVAPRDRPALFADIAGVWSRSSLLMHEMLEARGSVYVHVLQPNQYFSTRRFPAGEAATALSDASPYKRSVEEGYPLLVATGESELRPTHVRFFDATRVLDTPAEPVYMDNCCHYTRAGNHVLADFIAASILNSPGPWRP
ncbi:MAG: hypothetical protein HYU37_20675 [Acidobacteria bacterium]|nr:hypothetical protein [Acidobacteriota bacterium]